MLLKVSECDEIASTELFVRFSSGMELQLHRLQLRICGVVNLLHIGLVVVAILQVVYPGVAGPHRVRYQLFRGAVLRILEPCRRSLAPSICSSPEP